MTRPSVLPQSDTFGIRFASLLREAQSKHNAPFAGFSLPGGTPVVVSRKLLKSSIAGLTDAHIRVVRRAGLRQTPVKCDLVVGRLRFRLNRSSGNASVTLQARA